MAYKIVAYVAGGGSGTILSTHEDLEIARSEAVRRLGSGKVEETRPDDWLGTYPDGAKMRIRVAPLDEPAFQ